MSFLDEIAVLILTHDEAANIGRTLEALRAFPEIVVLDSESTDATAVIVGHYPNARLASRPFDDHATQWNYGLSKCGISKPWVLALDADYVLAPELVSEIALLRPSAATAGYRASFTYHVGARPLGSSLYPPVVALYRRERARYAQIGHTQRLRIEGPIEPLRHRIAHDDRKPLSRWLATQQRYAALEAAHLLAMPWTGLRWIDRLRRMAWPAPILAFLYTLLVQRCILDGWAGWHYVLQRTLAETLLALELVDRKLGHRSRQPIPVARTASTEPHRSHCVALVSVPLRPLPELSATVVPVPSSMASRTSCPASTDGNVDGVARATTSASASTRS